VAARRPGAGFAALVAPRALLVGSRTLAARSLVHDRAEAVPSPPLPDPEVPMRPRPTALAVLAAATALVALPALAAPSQAEGAPPAAGDSLRWDPALRRGVLPNGLRWIVKHNARPEARVSLRLVVPVGSTAEVDDQQGLAHFVEHMNFNGSAHFRDADDLVGYLRSIGLRFGADANAYTSFDETIYKLDVPSDRDSTLRTGLDALSDFAGRAIMADTEVERERGVVMEEWRLGRGAQERIERREFPVLFHDSRYASRLPIGKPEIIQGAPPQRVRDFYHDWYRPEWMTVVAVGDVDPAKMEGLIREHFGDLPKRTDARALPRFNVPGHDSTFVSIVTDKEATGSTVSIACTHPARPEWTVADARRDLAASLFSAMLGDRFQEIAHRAGAPFLSAYAGGFQFTRGTRLFYVTATVKDGGIAKGLESLLEETARVRAHGFLPSELERARRERRAELEKQYAERDKTESPGLASELVQDVLDGEPSIGIESSVRIEQALLPQVTLAEINALADTLISTRNRAVLASGPEKPGVTMPDEAEVRASLARAAAAKPGAWVDRVAGSTLMTKLPAPGHVRAARTIPELGVTVVTFANGVEAWLKPTDFKADEIQFSAYARGGLTLADSAGLVAAWMSPNVVNDNGVGGFRNTELQKLLAGRIVSLTPSVGPYTHGVRGSARPEDLETALQLLHLGFTHPTEDPEGYANLQQNIRTYLENRANSPDQVFADSALAVNTGRFDLTRLPSAGQVSGVTLAQALGFHRRAYANAADFTFFFAGNFHVDSITPLLARYLGSLPSAGRRTSDWVAKGPRFPDGITNVVVKKGVEPKGSVRITFFTHLPIEELDQHRAGTAASILTDHLRSSLRELLGGTYSPSARFANQAPVPGYSTMTLSFGCDPQRADTLITTALAEVRKLVEQGPSAADVTKEQEVQRRELETGLKQNGYWVGSLQTVHMLGWDARRIARRRERIELLTPENLHETFRRYFPADHYSVMRLEPETGKATP
jgi:zinc protease